MIIEEKILGCVMDWKKIITVLLKIVLPLISMGFWYWLVLLLIVCITANNGIIQIISVSVLSLSYLLANLLVWKYVIEDIKLEQMKERSKH